MVGLRMQRIRLGVGPSGPCFVSFNPSVFLRPFDARNIEGGDE
jgi:hypothetical protein